MDYSLADSQQSSVQLNVDDFMHFDGSLLSKHGLNVIIYLLDITWTAGDIVSDVDGNFLPEPKDNEKRKIMTEFANYREISAKLKKRFSLRKPNYLEAAESFKKLAHELSDFQEYSGFTLYSAAQCHHNNVVLLQEQKAKSNSGVNIFLPSSNTSTTSSRPGTAVQHSTGPGDLGKSRILEVAQQAEQQAWLEAGRELRKAGEVNGAIACYWHASQCCPESEVAMIYAEWAGMLEQERMHQEAADVYLEGGMLLEAINCLLEGQYFQDAYQCYQELIASLGDKKPSSADATKKRTTSRLSSFSTASSAVSFKDKTPSPTPSVASQQSQKSSNPFVNFFNLKKTPSEETIQQQKRKEEHEKETSGLDRESDSLLSSNSYSSPGFKCERNPFLHRPYLTADDHINLFLLKLYLYDPVNYEISSPIVPLPVSARDERRRRNSSNKGGRNSVDDNDGEEEGDKKKDKADTDKEKSSTDLDGATSTSDHLNRLVSLSGSTKFTRTKSDLTEINMLFETLFSSLKNELRRTVDHDTKHNMDMEQFLEHPKVDPLSPDELSPTSDSADDHHELDALESMLENAVLEREKLNKPTSGSGTGSGDSDRFTESLLKMINNPEDEWSLRQSIKRKLFPLLTPTQNQILSLIVDT